MSRNIQLAAVALALAGGVYLAGAPSAEASNMGFKLERSFDLVRGTNGLPLQNRYYVSHPLFHGIGDIANGAATEASKCVGDATGPAAGDGVIDSRDVLCDYFTARNTMPVGQAGSMAFGYWDSANCVPVTQSVSMSAIGNRMTFAGAPFSLIPDIGYQVLVGVPALATYSPTNRAVIVGSHDPSFAGHPLVFSTTCGPRAVRQDLINLPYHSMYRTSFEILCGLEIVDWTDDNADGKPDVCWDDTNADAGYDAGEPLTGIYDGLHTVNVAYWDNTPTRNGPVNTSAVFVAIGQRVSFPAAAYPLVPGEAYMVTMNAGHNSMWRSPHF